MSVPGANKNFFKNILPFGVMVIGAYIGLVQFRKINYGFAKNDHASVFKENLKQVGLSEDSYQYQATEGLEEEYSKTMQNIKLDDWKNIRFVRILYNKRFICN